MTPPTPIEVEAKYEVADPAAVHGLMHDARLGDGFVLGPGAVKLLFDTYLDTPDGRLRAAGLSLRLRSSGERARLTVKGRAGGPAPGGAIHARTEVERTLPDVAAWRDPATWPDAIRDAVRAAAGDGTVRVVPTVLLHQARYARLVHRAGGGAAAAPVAILSVEHVLVTHPDRDGSAGGRPRELAHWTECEAELCDGGTSDDLARLDAALRARPGLRPSTQSKLDRALAAGAPPAGADLG